MERYIFAKNIDGFKDHEGIMDMKTWLLICLCNEDNSKLLLKNLNVDIEAKQLQDRSNKLELLERYSLFLEKNGYMDIDWRAEKPYSIDEFMKHDN